MQGTEGPTQTAGQLTANSRYIEVQYATPKGFATPHFHPSEEEELEKKLISLKHRHIVSTVVNLLTGETVGGTGECLFDNTGRGRISHWNYWYCPQGIDAKEQPANSQKIVCDLSRL